MGGKKLRFRGKHGLGANGERVLLPMGKAGFFFALLGMEAWDPSDNAIRKNRRRPPTMMVVACRSFGANPLGKYDFIFG